MDWRTHYFSKMSCEGKVVSAGNGEMLVQGVIDLLDGAVDVAFKRKGFRLALHITRTRHAEVLSNHPHPHKAEPPTCFQVKDAEVTLKS